VDQYQPPRYTKYVFLSLPLFVKANVYRRSTAPVNPGPNRWQWYQISTAFATGCNGRRTLRFCCPWLPQYAQSRYRDDLVSGLVSTQLGIDSLSDPPGLDSDSSGTRQMLSLHCHTSGSTDSTLNGQSSRIRHVKLRRLISGELCHQSLFPHNRTTAHIDIFPTPIFHLPYRRYNCCIAD
jgi:hypothetical protein